VAADRKIRRSARADGGKPAGRGGEERRRVRPSGIIAASARAGRRYWWQILAVAIPVSLVSAGLEIVVDHYADPSDALLSFGATLGSTGTSLLGTVLLSGFICRLVGAAKHGWKPSSLMGVAQTLPWKRLIAADVLVALAVVVGFLLFVLPGLGALTLLAVVGPVIEIEHRRTLAAIRRSVQLTRRHIWPVLLLATAPLAIAAELEAIAPEPDRLGEIAEFLIIRGIGEGIVEGCLAVVLVELCFQLINAEMPGQPAGPGSR
jgi:hypothetical protein